MRLKSNYEPAIVEVAGVHQGWPRFSPLVHLRDSTRNENGSFINLFVHDKNLIHVLAQAYHQHRALTKTVGKVGKTNMKGTQELKL